MPFFSLILYMDFQSEFNTILQMRADVETKFGRLTDKMNEFRQQYDEIVKQHDKKIYLYSLDSLFFQYKLLRGDLENFQRTIALLNNRMYGDYYKFYVIIHSQCAENGIDGPKMDDTIPPYKDLEPTAEYSLDEICKIHAVILTALEHLNRLYDTKHGEIEALNNSMSVGFSITNFITTLNYENKVLKDHIRLFGEYLTFYHTAQTRNLATLVRKINVFVQDVEADILTNHKVFVKHGNHALEKCEGVKPKKENPNPVTETPPVSYENTDVCVCHKEESEAVGEPALDEPFQPVTAKRNRKKKK